MLFLDPCRIPQVAFSAKFLLCILMVAICGAVPSMADDSRKPNQTTIQHARLHNDCSDSELQVNAMGRVYAATNEHWNELELRSHGFNKMTIYAMRAQRYVCLNKKLRIVGKKMFGKISKRCFWTEIRVKSNNEDHGFDFYRSLVNNSTLMAMNRRGKPKSEIDYSLLPDDQRPKRHRHGQMMPKCSRFLKLGINIGSAIDAHNKGGQPKQIHLRRHR